MRRIGDTNFTLSSHRDIFCHILIVSIVHLSHPSSIYTSHTRSLSSSWADLTQNMGASTMGREVGTYSRVVRKRSVPQQWPREPTTSGSIVFGKLTLLLYHYSTKTYSSYQLPTCSPLPLLRMVIKPYLHLTLHTRHKIYGTRDRGQYWQRV